MTEERRSPTRDVFPETGLLGTTLINRAVRAALHEVGEMWCREQSYTAWLAR